MTATGWHREDIKAAIRKTGMTLTELASQAGIERTRLSHCLHQPDPAANSVIADYLGMPLNELWPEWFDANGARLPRTRKAITPAAGAQRQKRSAA